MYKIYLAPLQGYTDVTFRNIYQRHFTGIDKYFTPFIRRENDGIRKRDAREIANKTEGEIKVIPQLIANNANDFIWLAQHIQQQGFDELNLNIGCPFPMLVKRKMGSGMLPHPELLNELLAHYYGHSHPSLSVKMRLGLQSTDETAYIINILNNYPLKEVIIHPRTGKQKYSGKVYLEEYKLATETMLAPLVYNGDICTKADLNKVVDLCPTTNTFMIGRGILANPFLAEQIKKISCEEPENRRLQAFMSDLLDAQIERLSGDAHILLKMTSYWEYLANYFDKPKKVYKAIKKTKKVEEYSRVANDILR